jgi:hypothetical protein
VTRPLLAKHAGHMERDALYGCWLWVDSLDRDGYGTIWTGGPKQAHREFYKQLVGPVADGLVLDHLCRRRACVRPDHLEPVKGAVNDLRRSWRVRARRTRCGNGHDLSTCITTPSSANGGGGRLCRTCQGPGKGLDARYFAEGGDFSGIDRSVHPNPPRWDANEPRDMLADMEAVAEMYRKANR